MKNTIRPLVFIYIIINLLACKEAYFEPILTGHLQGEVLHADSFLPVENASVKLSPSVTTVLTDAKGLFRMDNLEVGKYTIEIRKDSFDIELATIEIKDAQITETSLLIKIEEHPNESPTGPFNPQPANGGLEQAIHQTLTWEATDADSEDALIYAVYLFAEGENSELPLYTNLSENQIEISDLAYGTTYFWQVVVSDGNAEAVYGPIWHFTTQAFPDNRFSWVRKVDGKMQIFSSNEMGNTLPLTNVNVNCWRPRISPNRKQVAFISNRKINPQLYLIDKTGQNEKQVTTLPVAGVDPKGLDYCWMSDGSQLLYTHNDRLFSIGKDGTGLSAIATAPEGQVFTSVDWTPNGNRLLVRTSAANVYDSEIYLIEMNGTREKLVDLQAGKTGNPVFSVDGKYILYTQDVSGFENHEGRQLDSHILMMDIANKTITNLSSGKPAGTNDLDPRFSPNGATIIFTNTDNDDISTKNIYQMDTTGEHRMLLFENAEMPAWK